MRYVRGKECYKTNYRGTLFHETNFFFSCKLQIWNHAKRYPHSRLAEYQLVCHRAGYLVSHKQLSVIFRKWNWSFKKAYYSIFLFNYYSLFCYLFFIYTEQFNKYTLENTQYYADFKYTIQFIPWKHLKFCDESHFKSKGTFISYAIFILFYFILFYFILFYFILLYFFFLIFIY